MILSTYSQATFHRAFAFSRRALAITLDHDCRPLSFVRLQHQRTIRKRNGEKDTQQGVLSQNMECLMSEASERHWSHEAIDGLIKYRGQGLPPTEISRRLGKSTGSTEGMLRRLGSSPFEKMLAEGCRRGNPIVNLDISLFHERLHRIWRGLIQSDMTPAWRAAISNTTAEEWLTPISEGIPTNLKILLANQCCPTFQDLRSLPLLETNDPGVYARLVGSRHEIQIPVDRQVYVGSASQFGRGLSGRILQHNFKAKKRDRSRLQRNITRRRLSGPGSFVTLMTMKFPSSKAGDVVVVRRTVVIAKAILTIWLGALQSPSPGLKSLYPWYPWAHDYTGCSSHNPLLVDIVEPKST